MCSSVFFFFSKPVAAVLHWKLKPEVVTCALRLPWLWSCSPHWRLAGRLDQDEDFWTFQTGVHLLHTLRSRAVGSSLALSCRFHICFNLNFLFMRLKRKKGGVLSTFPGLPGQTPVPPPLLSVLTMLRRLHFRHWNLFREASVEGKQFFVCLLHLSFPQYDRWEQKRAQSWEREGLGETAPSASVRPKWTSEDWAGLRRDARVPLGK